MSNKPVTVRLSFHSILVMSLPEIRLAAGGLGKAHSRADLNKACKEVSFK